MPRGDGTGPLGQGPQTGRAAGFCAGSGEPGYVSSPAQGWWQGRFGVGAGYGRRRGFRAFGSPFRPGGRYPAVASSTQAEVDYLTGEAGRMQSALADIQRRLEELKEK
jgi:hypothetical protein